MGDVAFFNFGVSPSDLLTGVKHLVKLVRPHWKDDLCTFKVFTEGISNQLVGCFPENGESAILFRVYGEGTELFVDRDAEKRNMVLLWKAGLGPELIASFENGIIYYFVPGSLVTADSVSDPQVWPLIARKLAAMHKLKMAGPCVVWSRIRTFVNSLPQDFQKQYKFIRLPERVPTKDELIVEVDWFEKVLKTTKSPLVFCHNDLLLGNIIVNDKQDDVAFIDYEYGGANHQAFDIANHFCEYAGVSHIDFSRVPSAAYQRSWIREYLTEYAGIAPSESDLDATARQVLQFIPIAHFHWAVWGLLQAVHSKIDFDFADYGRIKLREYFNSKLNVEEFRAS